MDTSAYLQRINYYGPLTPTAETLRDVQLAHLLSVPFENLSIHSGEPIVLHDDALFDKIVKRRRGGFCYELNGLFAALLRAMGFDVSMIAGSAMNADGEFGSPFDHMALLVTLGDQWLVDVGFGDSFREPLRLVAGLVQDDRQHAYRIDRNGERLTVMRQERGEWRAQYRFGLDAQTYTDYAGMCRYHQTSSESHFTQQRVCSRATPDGRITISGVRLITAAGGRRHERHLEGEDEYAEALRVHFGIVLSR